MTQPLKISIIVPVYNVEPYIFECLQSVMQQTYKGPIECIIVDDCGTDNSIEIAEKLVSKYEGPIRFEILHHEKNRGLAAARNTGVSVATGEYVFFLDSDDYISDNCIEVLTDPLHEERFEMVVGDVESFGFLYGIDCLPHIGGSVCGNETIFRGFCVDLTLNVMACNKLVKRSLFKDFDLVFLEGQLHEDELWSYKCSRVLQSLFVQKQVTYHYRIRENSITSKTDWAMEKKKLDSRCCTLDYVLTNPAAVEKSLYDKCVVHYFGIFLRNAFDWDFDYRKDYLSLRRKFDYKPLLLWLKGNLIVRDLKHQFHLALPAELGYCFLKMKRFKHKLLQS